MSLARRHQERILARQAASAPAPGGGFAGTAAVDPAAADHARATRNPGGIIAATIAMRLTHDLRRLSEIKSIDMKIAAKRSMLPEYLAWVDGVLEAGRTTNGRELSPTGADDVLPAIMVWAIDIGDWLRALALAAHVIRFNVALPSRYNRDAATLVLEEIAVAALKVQAKNERFPLWVLEAVEELTLGIDMHDEPRAKLLKAIGTELIADANAAQADAAPQLVDRALAKLTRAQALHDRVGVKTQIRGLEKLRAALPQPAPAETQTEQTGEPPAA